ncbi:MAG: hydrogenase maturation nickel metallochaperone HypA [Fibrobacter sp.]|nr:hydrogenase maturation nickel metallochaperone HypA [Fibrobacter sp.]
MHELGIATEIIEIVESLIPEPQILTNVVVTTSPLSGISTESLAFCFDELCRLKGYVQAKLEVNTASVTMKCLNCGKEYNCRMLDTFCPECGKTDRDVLHVPPFKIEYIETAV